MKNAINEYQWFSFFDYCKNEFYKPEIRKEYRLWRKERKQKQKTAEHIETADGTTGKTI